VERDPSNRYQALKKYWDVPMENRQYHNILNQIGGGGGGQEKKRKKKKKKKKKKKTKGKRPPHKNK